MQQQEQHLRPVPPPSTEAESTDTTDGTNGQGGGESSGTTTAKPRPRPSKALPTDRMKLEVQKQALSTIAILSNYGENGVTAADMAPRLDKAPTTAGLNNSFFVESGLIEQTGKGRYKSTDAANDFARRFSFNEDEAGLCLREPLSKTWYFQTVKQQIAGFGPTPREKLIELLAYAAKTTNDHRVQLASLLSWLEYAGLIELDDGHYKLTSEAPDPEAADATDDEQSGEAEKERPTPSPEGATRIKAPEGGDQDQSTETILGFNFDFTLTGEQLAKLSPEQITALFKAVGEVMAIKAAATK